jgi:hypothetical protein
MRVPAKKKEKKKRKVGGAGPGYERALEISEDGVQTRAGQVRVVECRVRVGCGGNVQFRKVRRRP